MIYTVKTTVGQENLVVEMVAAKVREEGLEVYSALTIPGLRGYVMFEASDEMTLRRAIEGVPKIKGRGLVAGEIKIEEIEPQLEAKHLMGTIKEGMTIEVIQGPFKGEKGRVLRVNTAKEEVTVELLEAAVKIPITIHAGNIKVLKE